MQITYIVPSGNRELVGQAAYDVLANNYDIKIDYQPIDVPHHYARTKVTLTFLTNECYLAYSMKYTELDIVEATITEMARIANRRWNVDRPI